MLLLVVMHDGETPHCGGAASTTDCTVYNTDELSTTTTQCGFLVGPWLHVTPTAASNHQHILYF